MVDLGSIFVRVALSPSQRMRRVYGIWWDLINLGTVAFLLTVAFIVLSIALMTDQLWVLPFQDLIWTPFSAQVDIGRRSEMGLSALSITISAGSATALYLVRVGTSRWAMNRRIGNIFQFFADELAYNCSRSDYSGSATRATVEGFISATSEIFVSVSETHPLAQASFERARMQAHIYLADQNSGNIDAVRIALDLFCAAAVCNKSTRVSLASKGVLALVRTTVAKL